MNPTDAIRREIMALLGDPDIQRGMVENAYDYCDDAGLAELTRIAANECKTITRAMELAGISADTIARNREGSGS